MHHDDGAAIFYGLSLVQLIKASEQTAEAKVLTVEYEQSTENIEITCAACDVYKGGCDRLVQIVI